MIKRYKFSTSKLGLAALLGGGLMTDTLAGWGWRGGLLMTESLLLPGGGLITCTRQCHHGPCYQPPTVLLLATLLAALS